MSDAFEALADIRRWACETLDASDAGRLCGILSEVSRHANGLEAENLQLRKENDDLTRLANIDAMMIFLSRNCSFKDCEKCDANPLCDEAVYLQGLYGIDKDLACGADMRWKLLEGVSSDNALIGWGESGTEADDD
jgi:hypothetical protein